VGLGPLHNAAQLRPVVHFLKLHQLHRRAGDDQAVKGAVGHLVEGFVKGEHMLLGCVFGYMAAGGDQLQVDLQGRVSQNPGQLGLGVHLGGHQVQKQDLQRPDILGDGPGLGHDEDIFLCQRAGGRQLVGNFNGHVFRASKALLLQRNKE
jgi:hypothetical protein